MSAATYRARLAAHEALRLRDLTRDGRAGGYTEVVDDEEWVLRDERGDWGGDDSHNDMLAFRPTDACLIEWRCGPGRKRWVERGELYDDERSDYGREIRKRVAELDARFNRFGREAGREAGA